MNCCSKCVALIAFSPQTFHINQISSMRLETVTWKPVWETPLGSTMFTENLVSPWISINAILTQEWSI